MHGETLKYNTDTCHQISYARRAETTHLQRNKNHSSRAELLTLLYAIKSIT